jgi:hypothetical protein
MTIQICQIRENFQEKAPLVIGNPRAEGNPSGKSAKISVNQSPFNPK